MIILMIFSFFIFYFLFQGLSPREFRGAFVPYSVMGDAHRTRTPIGWLMERSQQ